MVLQPGIVSKLPQFKLSKKIGCSYLIKLHAFLVTIRRKKERFSLLARKIAV